MTHFDTTNELWHVLRENLKNVFSEDIYTTWFAPLQCVEEVFSGRLILLANNDFAVMWLENNYRDLFEKKITQIVGHPVTVEFKCSATEVSEDKKTPKTVAKSVKTAVASPKIASGQGLIPQNTFENFIVGAGSQLAHAAAIAVSNAPGRAYNPLFLYGNTGLGKTHLMQAVGHHILRNQPNAKVIYITTERFTNDFIFAIQENQLVKFRRKYRGADVLLIDDIHFLAGKERIQEEFFHTFNELFESQRQIFLCSDRPAAEISKLESRLVSRFQWGLVCDIQPPDFETRVAILTKKAQSLNLVLDKEVIEFLAERVTKNVRRMEGALNRIAGYQRLLHTDTLSIEKVESILQDILQEELATRVTIDDIQKKICDFYHLTMTDLLGKKRPANIAFPRQVAMYLCRLLTQASLQEIGIAFGGRDHGTVIHACKSVENTLQQEPSTKRTLQFLQQKLINKE